MYSFNHFWGFSSTHTYYSIFSLLFTLLSVTDFIYRIQYGFGQFSLGDIQSYYLLFEPNSYGLKIVVIQEQKNICLQKQQEAFRLFIELMVYLEESIFSVMDLYIPSTTYPVLHVCCPICDNPDPHIMLEHASRISLSLPPLFCAQQGPRKILNPSSYLPFGDTLKQQDEIGKLYSIYVGLLILCYRAIVCLFLCRWY